MISSNFIQNTCAGCHFIPFCLHEEGASCSTQALHLVKTRRHLKRNDVLCSPKNKFQNLYAIQSGALKTYQVAMQGKELINGFYFAGEILGYKTIYNGYYSSTVIALTDTIVCEIPYERFLKVLHLQPALQKHILHLISKQLNVGNYRGSSTAEQRVAAFLIDLLERMHVLTTTMTIVLPMIRQDIGNYLGLTAETVSRIFSKFQKNKIIEINHKHMQVINIKKLKFIAEYTD